MAAGSTYTPIATTTLGSATTSYSFSSIPSTYTDLIMVWNGTAAAQDNVSLRFNSDTATNCSVTRLRGDGSTASSSRWSNINMIYGSIADTSGSSTVTWHVMNYANSTTYKTALCLVMAWLVLAYMHKSVFGAILRQLLL